MCWEPSKEDVDIWRDAFRKAYGMTRKEMEEADRQRRSWWKKFCDWLDDYLKRPIVW